MERFHAGERGNGEDELVSFFGQQNFLFDTPTNSMLEVAPLIADNDVSKRHCSGHPRRFLPKMAGEVTDFGMRRSMSYDAFEHDFNDEPTMSKDDVIEDGWPESLDSLAVIANEAEQGLSAENEAPKRSPETQNVAPFKAFRSFVRNGRSRNGPKVKIHVQEPLPQSRDECPEELSVPVRSFASDRLEALEKEVNAAAVRDGAHEDSDQDSPIENRAGANVSSSPHQFVPVRTSDEIPILSRKTQLESSQSFASVPPAPTTKTTEPSTGQGFLPVASTNRVSQAQTPTTSNRSFPPVAAAGLTVVAVAPTAMRSSAAAVQSFQPIAMSGLTRSNSLESSIGGFSRLYLRQPQGKNRSNSVNHSMDASQLYPGKKLGIQQVQELSKTPQRRVTRKDQVLAQRTAEKSALAKSQSKRLQRGFGLNSRQENSKGKTTEKKSKEQNKNLGAAPKTSLLGRLRRGRSVDKEPEESVVATFPVITSKQHSSKKSTKSSQEASKDVDPFVVLGITKPPKETKENRQKYRQRTRSLTGIFKKPGNLEQKPSHSFGSSTLVMGNTASGTVSTRATSAESGQQICSRSVFSLSSDQGKEGTASAESKNASSKSVFSLRNQSSRSNKAKTTSAESQKSAPKSAFSLRSNKGREKTASAESKKSTSKSVFSLGKQSSRSNNARTASAEHQKSATKSAFSVRSASGIAAASSNKEPVKKGRTWGRRIRTLDTFFKNNHKTSEKGAGAIDTSIHESETSSIWRLVAEDDRSLQTKGSLRGASRRKQEPEPGVIETFIESLFDYALDDWDSESSDYSSDNEASFSSLSETIRRPFREDPKPSDPMSNIGELVTGAFGGSWLYGSSPSTSKKKIALMG